MANPPDAPGISSTIYLILIQIFSRGITFIGNQALLRYLSPSHLGLAVQLETLSISVLYTARESLRVALQRPDNSHGRKADQIRLQAAVNASYLVPVLGLLLGASFGAWYLQQASEEVLTSKDFSLAFLLYSLATIIELVAEPGFIIIQQRSLFRDRARAETTAAVSRCIAACTTTIYMHKTRMTLSVLSFAIGQLMYALSLLTIYSWSAIKSSRAEVFSLLPAKLQSSNTLLSIFSKDLLSLATALYGQSIFKWLLTQGDVLVLSLFADLQAQGTFALASNYGGLVSRLLFQPVEESSRNTFGNFLSAPTAGTTTEPQRPPEDHNSKPKSALNQKQPQKQQTPSSPQQALSYLSTTLHGYVLLIGIPSITLLPYIFPLAIETLLGSRSVWSSTQTHDLLAAYSYYIPCLAINGILDAFVTSIATEKQLGIQSLVMLGITLIYLTAAYIGIAIIELGAVGLVYANILNMTLRTAFSVWFIHGWSATHLDGTEAAKPKPKSDLSMPTSSFARFCKASVPSGWCLFSAVVVTVVLRAQTFVREMVKDVEGMPKLLGTRVGPVDLFEASYLVSAGIVLLSSVALTEREFLATSLEPLLPQRVKNMLQRYLPFSNRNTKAS